MTASIPQDRTDPLLRQWRGKVNSEGDKETPFVAPQVDPVVPAPVAIAAEVVVPVAPRFTVTEQTVTILHGGSSYVYQGHQTTHRIHKDANGVEHIVWNKVMQPLPNLNVNVVRRERVAKG
jgi:hypothetical protein